MNRTKVLELPQKLIDAFERNKNSDLAPGMQNYMKNKFSFYGIKSEKRKELQKQWFSLIPSDLSQEEFWFIIQQLWEQPFRELHYSAIDFLNARKDKFISVDDLKEIKFLILNHSWWDSVDGISSNYLGRYLKKYPGEINAFLEDWSESDNIWLKRSTLIFQLKYKDKVDFDVLKAQIRKFVTDDEFFIQKAIGWSLRQYSKFNPDAVREFLKEEPLKGVALREASKYI